MPDCVFCKIIRGEIPSTVVYEDAAYVAIRDLHPQAAIHVLLLPRRHWPDLLALADDPASADTAQALPHAVAGTAHALWIDASGFRLIANCGADAGQSVAHVHYHLLGGEPLGERIR